MEKFIQITSDEDIIADCVSIIIVPEIAIKEAGYIKMLTVKDAAQAKHEYHTLAQMAYFQFQDEELEIQEIESAVTVICGDEKIDLSGGMIICRDQTGDFHVFIHVMQNRKKILEAAYRYCARWVRLDL